MYRTLCRQFLQVAFCIFAAFLLLGFSGVAHGQVGNSVAPIDAPSSQLAPNVDQIRVDLRVAQSTTETPAQPADKTDDATAPSETSPDDKKDLNSKVDVPPAILELIAPVEFLKSRLEALEEQHKTSEKEDSLLLEQLAQAEQIIVDANALKTKILPKLEDVKSSIGKLGPPPKEDEARTEAQQIIAERAKLNAQLAQIDGAIKQADLIGDRADQLIEQIQATRQEIFTNNLFDRSENVFSRYSWQNFVDLIPRAASRVTSALKAWWSKAMSQGPLLAVLVGIAALIYFGMWRFARRRIGRHLSTFGEEAPNAAARYRFAGWLAPLSAIPTVVSFGFLYAGLGWLKLLDRDVRSVFLYVLVAVALFAIISALARAYLQPRLPGWRIADVSDEGARRLRRCALGAAAIYGLDLVLSQTIEQLYLPLDVNVLESAVANLGFSFILGLTFLRPLQPMAFASGAQTALLRPQVLRWPAFIVALAIAIITIFGYVALGRFTYSQVVIVGTVLALLFLLHLSARGFAALAGDDQNDIGAAISARSGLSGERQKDVLGVFAFLFDCLLFLLALPVLLLGFGFSPVDVLNLGKQLLYGFEFGGITISPARILGAIVVFVALLALTRFFQRWLSHGPLKESRTDPGLANSVRTVVGYAGFALAVLLALAYGGLNITNLAIVAGALSVGIGFGLQSIVNNFVSGLILLVERPIQVGDRIKVGDLEGYVRRISVRSTIVETFERADVIIPNSELISGTVTNLTHRNALGRVKIEVGVSYKSDPVLVQSILLDIAHDCDQVLKHPEPFVVFQNFGDSALEFSLCAYLGDINQSLGVQTAMRTEIHKAFAKHGIEIPYPQTDVHLRDLDGFRKVLARAAEEGERRFAGSAAAEGQKPASAKPTDKFQNLSASDQEEESAD